jgi:hypothetical protein
LARDSEGDITLRMPPAETRPNISTNNAALVPTRSEALRTETETPRMEADARRAKAEARGLETEARITAERRIAELEAELKRPPR